MLQAQRKELILTSKITPRSSSQLASAVSVQDIEPMKRGNYRNAELLAKVRELPCVHCGLMGVQAAHSNKLAHGKGRGMKASDAAIMALCQPEHYQVDDGTRYSRAERQLLQDSYIVKTYAALERMGYLHIPAEVWQLHGNADIALELIARMEAGELLNKGTN